RSTLFPYTTLFRSQRACVVQAQRHIHSPFAEGPSDAIAPGRHRRAVGQRLMGPPLVVEGDPLGDPGFGLATIGVSFEIDVLVFQAAPQAFDEDVVDPATPSIHRDLDAGRERAGEGGGAGELAA